MNQSLDEAQTECESMDGHLVEIDNEMELNYLARLWKNDPWLLRQVKVVWGNKIVYDYGNVALFTPFK